MRYRIPAARNRSEAAAVGNRSKLWRFQLGFWLLTLSWGVMTLNKTRWEINSIWLSAPVLILGMLVLLGAVGLDWNLWFGKLTGGHKLVVVLLILWCMVTTARGAMDMRWYTIRDLLGIRYFGWAWLVPPMLLFGMDPAVLRNLLSSICLQNKAGLFLFVLCLFPPLSLLTDFNLNWGCSAVLIFWHYLPKWGRRFVLAGATLNLSLAVLASSRNEVLGHGLLLMAAGWVAMLRPGGDRFWRQFLMLLLSLFAVGLAYYASSQRSIPLIGDRLNARLQVSLKDFDSDRLLNSRVGESRNLYKDFLEVMSSADLVVGRGAMGAYESPGTRDRPDATKDRRVIECGYMQVILKGGGIMIILMLLLAAPAIWLGWFRSSNWIVRGFAAIVAAWLVEMVPFALPSAFPRYLLFWMAVGVCLSPFLRNMTDAQIEASVFGWRRVPRSPDAPNEVRQSRAWACGPNPGSAPFAAIPLQNQRPSQPEREA